MTVTSQVPAEVTGAERPAPAPEASAVPEGFPAKFVKDGKPDYAALAQSYTALETKLGAPPVAPAAAPAAPAATTQEAATTELTNGLAAAGLDINTFYGEYSANGKLSDDSYAKLAAAGRPKAEVDAYIAGQEALFEQQATAIYESVGGEAEFKKVQTWAVANVPKAELKAFNDIVEKGSVDAVKLAVQGLNARYVAVNGRAPTLIGGEPTAAVGFNSKAEVVAAMSDPRYKKDEAYRASVIRKMAAGGAFNRR